MTTDPRSQKMQNQAENTSAGENLAENAGQPDPTTEPPATGVTEESREYVVVVGVSDTSNSPTALAWAMDMVRARGGRLIAVRASTAGGGFNAYASAPATGRRPLEPEVAKLKADVISVLGAEAVEGPDAVVDVHVFRGETSRVLRNVSKNASLLVLDAPRNPVTQPLLAPRVVYNVDCPVVMMPPTISGDRPSRWMRAFDSMGRAIARGTGTAGRPGLGGHL